MKTVAHSGKTVLRGLLATLGLAALAVQPLVAHAANPGLLAPFGGPVPKTTMYESYLVFPTGTRVPGSGTTTSVLVQGKQDTLSAPATIPGTVSGSGYQFLFWDIAGQLYTTEAVTFTAPSQATFDAQAWYDPYDPCGTPCPPPPPPYVETYAFSLIQTGPLTGTLPGTPIASVLPLTPTAWTPPSQAVSTTTAVTITAQSYMAGSQTFVQWLPFAPGLSAGGVQLSAGAGVYGFAIAFYGPNPCQSLMDNPPQPWEFPNPAAYQAAMKAWAASVEGCEKSHGLPT